MKSFLPIILVLFIFQASGQQKTTNYISHEENTYVLGNKAINRITINENGTFEFKNTTHTSCLLWKTYKGKWKKEKDTLFFQEQYDLMEKEVQFKFRQNTEEAYTLKFKTDKNSPLKNKMMQIEFVYDFDAHLENSKKTYTLSEDNILKIQYHDIAHLEKLASIRLVYLHNDSIKYDGYITENKTVNILDHRIPNLVEIVFIENPIKETIYRTTKGVIKDTTLEVITTVKTKSITQSEDNYYALNFQKKYTLLK